MTFFVRLENFEEILALLDLSVGVGVSDLREVLHESEISSHGFGEPSLAAELGDECDLVSSLNVLVDEKRLVRVVDVLIVASLVVLLIAARSSVLVEGGFGTLVEVNSLDPVGPIVVSCDHTGSTES